MLSNTFGGHDQGLRGPIGARKVLQQLQESPAISRLILSHNDLGDAGVQGKLTMWKSQCKD